MKYTEAHVEQVKKLLHLKVNHVFKHYPTDLMEVAFRLLIDNTKDFQSYVQISNELDKYESKV